MSSHHHITDATLPLSQNFSDLRQQGLDFIQEHSGNEWTNLNLSDPGITILDQVCYALTELGYCNDFPVEDILARQDGKVQVHDRFYRPADILTTAPVTISDYRRYLIDGVAGVTNAIITLTTNSESRLSQYQVYLQLEPALLQEKTNEEPATCVNPEAALPPQNVPADHVCEAAFYYLNKSRNLCEGFSYPQYLMPVRYQLTGRIEVSNSDKVYELLKALNDAIASYIFPVVKQTDYVFSGDTDINESYNGPFLPHGAIPDSCLGQKREAIHIFDIVVVAEGISGIKTATFKTLTLVPGQPVVESARRLLTIDLSASIADGLEIWCNGSPLFLSVTRLKHIITGSGTKLADPVFTIVKAKEPDLPKGRFRDIADYYSIQNTFPDIFAVGANSIGANATDYQIAQSRQLKGYLTLFDQVLANQFAQLANIGRLFSFTNTPTTDISFDIEHPQPDDLTLLHEKAYPAEYRAFSPTYFFQPLYHVPHIRPLLKGNEIFNFSEVEQVAKGQAEHTFIAYQNDPYNPYIRGLMEYTEEAATNLERRNNILNHLLARHGESPLLIDTYAETFAYTGNHLQGRIIIKSLYLQNLGLLSYNRCKAYNFPGANKLDATLPDISEKDHLHLLQGHHTDFIFDTKRLDKIEKLHSQDFIWFSAIELKLNLLFALRLRYERFIVDNYPEPANEQQVKQALWMMQQRRGIIFIEGQLLQQSANIVDGEASASGVDSNLFSNGGIHVILPTYLFPKPEALQKPVALQLFQERLYLFLRQELPVYIPYQCHFVDSETMAAIIPSFCNWHNSLISKTTKKGSEQQPPNASALTLMKMLSEINSTHHA